jgi:hypothetical protein
MPILGRVQELADLNRPENRAAFLKDMDMVCRNLANACAARAFLECVTD